MLSSIRPTEGWSFGRTSREESRTGLDYEGELRGWLPPLLQQFRIGAESAGIVPATVLGWGARNECGAVVIV